MRPSLILMGVGATADVSGTAGSRTGSHHDRPNSRSRAALTSTSGVASSEPSCYADHGSADRRRIITGWQKLWQDPEIAKQWRERPPLPEVVAMADLLEGEGRRRALDIGCGVGRHTIYLASRGFEVTATDNAPAAVHACRRNLEAAGLQAQVLEAEMTEIPFPDAYFDGVVAAQVIHHTDVATLAGIIILIHQKLAAGGLFVWAMPSPRNRDFSKGREVEPGTWVDENRREGPLPHHYCTEQEIRSLLASYDIESLEEKLNEYSQAATYHWRVIARKSAAGTGDD